MSTSIMFSNASNKRSENKSFCFLTNISYEWFNWDSIKTDWIKQNELLSAKLLWASLTIVSILDYCTQVNYVRR